MKKKIMVASGVATVLAAAATAVSGIVLSNKLMFIKLKDIGFVSNREKEARRFDEVWLGNCPKIELNVNSPNGYAIRGTFYQPLNTTNTVIVIHGVTENKINMMKYIRMYERLGFNTVVYDQRRHGESGGKTTSYGYYEKYDLEAIVDEVREIIGQDAILGIHGESMGAATTLLYAGTVRDDADFYISDCSFSDFRKQLRKIVRETVKFNFELAVRITNLAVKMRDGYLIDQVNPLQAVANIERPVLFIHSKPDDFIPVEMAQELYDAKGKGVRELVLFEKGEHAQSFNDSPELYEKTVQQFITKHVRQDWASMDGAS